MHPIRMEGGVDRASRMRLILRDFELDGLAEKREILRRFAVGCRARNPRQGPMPDPQAIPQHGAIGCARTCGRWNWRVRRLPRVGLKPYDHPIRGGTDGSRLTELGLPTPNLFCGEHNAARTAGVGGRSGYGTGSQDLC